MGLDGHVYKTIDEILQSTSLKRSELQIDDYSGEVYAQEDGLLSLDDATAIHRRLGNMSAIALLREEVKKLPQVGANSILLENVLYSGTHAGDAIPADQMPRLLEEIRLVRTSPSPSDYMLHFLTDMEDLANAAIARNKPLAF